MSIDARIAAVETHRDHVTLRLRSKQASDGSMSIAGRESLTIAAPYVTIPKAGQAIWGDAGTCIVEAGFGGGRIVYKREGSTLREVTSEEGV
jgi:hypothetical protein